MLRISHQIFVGLSNQRTRSAERMARRGDRRSAYRALVERSEENGPLGRPRRR